MRVINERHAHEERLAYLSRFDDLTGEMNRWRLTEVLETTLDEAVKCRSACGFLLLAVDNLTRINEAYGYDVADEVIGAVAKRLRAKLRTGDTLGRFSGNKFGVVLRNCSLEEMAVAAERLLSGVRDDVVQTGAGSIAVTMSAGGVVAPRHARDVQEMLARAQETLSTAQAPSGPARSSAIARAPNARLCAAKTCGRPTRSSRRSTTAASCSRSSRWSRPTSRKPAFYECLMRIRARRRDAGGRACGHSDRRAARPRAADRQSRAGTGGRPSCVASPDSALSLNVSPASTVDPDWWASLGARLRAHPGVAERLIVEITEMAAIHDIDETRGFVAA